MTMLRVSLLAALAAVAACVPKREAPPPPVQQPPVPPRAAPAPPPPPPAAADWRDRPLTQGAWSYRGGDAAGPAALFGSPAAPLFVVRCDRTRRQVMLERPGAVTGPITVRTTSLARSFPATAAHGAAIASVSANDRFLDMIAFSRGRFSVEMPGAATLLIPAWPEPARVIEDCRS